MSSEAYTFEYADDEATRAVVCGTFDVFVRVACPGYFGDSQLFDILGGPTASPTLRTSCAACHWRQPLMMTRSFSAFSGSDASSDTPAIRAAHANPNVQSSYADAIAAPLGAPVSPPHDPTAITCAHFHAYSVADVQAVVCVSARLCRRLESPPRPHVCY
jgi:hypothetical protein